MTNAHVVGGAAKIIVRWRGQRGTAVKHFEFRPEVRPGDTADLVRPPRPPCRSPTRTRSTVGQDVVVLGSPQGLEGTVSTGIVGGLRTLGDVKFLQITAPISPGSSGGPVFNSVGRVIGVATATSAKGQNLNFALPVNLLRDLPPASIAFNAAMPAALDLREGDRLKDLVYFNNIIEEFGIFTEGTTLASLTASLQNRTAETIADVTHPGRGQEPAR